MKCVYANCLHDTKEILEGEDFRKDKNKYYHLDCWNYKHKINEIITLFSEQVNPNVVFTVLRSVINNLIFKQKNEPGYVLYAIKYAINHPQMKLTYPQGLYRICKDNEVLESYKKLKADKILEGQKVKIDTIQYNNLELNNTKKKKNVSDLFGGY